MTRPERYELAPGLEISRIVTGLWQVADMEHDGGTLDLDHAAAALADYVAAGFDSFDMAPAEPIVVGPQRVEPRNGAVGDPVGVVPLRGTALSCTCGAPVSPPPCALTSKRHVEHRVEHADGLRVVGRQPSGVVQRTRARRG